MRIGKVRHIAAVLLGLVLAGACAADEAAEIKTVHDLMVEDLEPAAEVIWDSAGWVLTAEGEEELWPTNAAGWAAVVVGAARVVAVSRRLAEPAYAAGLPDWAEFSEALAVVATRAKRAAEAEDNKGLFDEGGHLYLACVACHKRYMVEPAD